MCGQKMRFVDNGYCYLTAMTVLSPAAAANICSGISVSMWELETPGSLTRADISSLANRMTVFIIVTNQRTGLTWRGH